MKIVVPMAGKGSRFLEEADKNPEYKNPKPLINVKNQPMVSWALKSLPFVDLPNRKAKTKFKVLPKDLIFICRQDHEDDFAIGKKLKKIFGKEVHIVYIKEITRGAAETVLKAKKYIDSEDDLLISDSDHFFDGENLYQIILAKEDNVSGAIPVFTVDDKDAKWSYTLADKTGTALAVGEKDVELAKKGAFANIGGYYFSKGKFFIDETEDMISKNEKYGAAGKEEFYIAPVYDRLIKKGHKIKVAVTPKVWGLGTPADLEYFLKNFKD